MLNRALKIRVFALAYAALASASSMATTCKLPERFEKSLARLEAQVDSRPMTSLGAGLAMGATPGLILKHYRSLFCDLAKFTGADQEQKNLGVGANGYTGIRNSISPRDRELLLQEIPSALAWYSEQVRIGIDPTFPEYKSHFSGSAKRALLSIILSNYWPRRALCDDKISNSYYYLQGSSYGVEPFSAKAFGYDFTPGKSGVGSFGRAYKTVAGMNLALALWEENYSNEEILWVIQSSVLTYEAADLLYDHLGKSGKDVGSANDATYYGKLIPRYDALLRDFQARFTRDPKLKEAVLYSVMDLKAPARTLNLLPVSMDDEFESTVALLALYTVRADLFFANFKSHFTGKDGLALLRLIKASRDDIRTLVRGAEFSLHELGSKPFTRPNYLERLQFWLLHTGWLQTKLLDPRP